MRLRRWGHVVFALGYTALAAVVALVLLVVRPQTDPVVVALAAFQVLVAGGLGHEVATRLANERKLNDRMVRMRQAYEDLVDLILKTRTERKRATGTEPAPAPTVPPHPAALWAHEPAPVSHPPAHEDSAAVAAMVREALAENRVETFLQPIVTLPGRKHRAYEVLARIRLRDDSVLLPDRFLAVAERERLMPAIDGLMLDRAGRLIHETDRRQHAINFFCNISPQTLTDPGFLGLFLHPDGDYQSLRGKLVFEMSQRDLTAELSSPAGVIDDLGRAGFRFSMDQVEHHTLDPYALIERGVHFIKLNCAHFSALERRTGVMDLRRRLSGPPIDVIVEKIETEHQLHELADLGIEYGQGFLFAEPRLSRRVS